MESKPDPRQLEASIRRVQEAISRGQGTHLQLLQTVLAAAGAHAVDAVSAKVRHRLAREAEREERRRLRREAEGRAAGPQGYVLGVAAMVAIYFAMTRPGLWWMVFVALGLAMASVKSLARGRRYQAEQEQLRREALAQGAVASPAAALAEDPVLAQIAAREERVDATRERLLAELASAPRAVHEFVQKPEATIEALCTACHELARRERELRSALPAAEDLRLRKERAELEGRIAGESDEVARSRLRAALEALEGQLTQRAELATQATRFEAESTRILYTLENLRTQVLRARSADAASADVVGAGLRRSVSQMTHEMDAVAEALEQVSRDSPVHPERSEA